MLHHFNRATTNIQPTFIGSNAVRGSAGSAVTVTAISNVQAGDLLIAFIVYATSGATPTNTDAGWTLRSTNSGLQTAWALLTKVATGSEASYIFQPSSGASSVSVLAYRGCEPCQVQVGTTTYANSATQTGASITASNQGTLLFFSANELGTLTITTAPTGMTQRSFVTSGSPSAAVYELANVSQGTVTGNKTIVYSGVSADGLGVLVQIKTAQRQVITPQYIAQANAIVTTNNTNITINKPTGTVENDLMVVLLVAGNTTNTFSLSGWTSILTNAGTTILYRVAGASEGASYTFVQSASNTSQGVIATFRYCSYDTIGTAVTGQGPSYYSVTTASKYQLCIIVGSRPAGSAYVAQGGIINIFQNNTAPSVLMGYVNAVGDGTFYGKNVLGSSSNNTGVAIALKGLVSS